MSRRLREPIEGLRLTVHRLGDALHPVASSLVGKSDIVRVHGSRDPTGVAEIQPAAHRHRAPRHAFLGGAGEIGAPGPAPARARGRGQLAGKRDRRAPRPGCIDLPVAGRIFPDASCDGGAPVRSPSGGVFGNRGRRSVHAANARRVGSRRVGSAQGRPMAQSDARVGRPPVRPSGTRGRSRARRCVG